MKSVSTKDLLDARRNAKRIRALKACARCKSSKSKCSDYRPCKNCTEKELSCNESKKCRSNTNEEKKERSGIKKIDSAQVNSGPATGEFFIPRDVVPSNRTVLLSGDGAASSRADSAAYITNLYPAAKVSKNILSASSNHHLTISQTRLLDCDKLHRFNLQTPSSTTAGGPSPMSDFLPASTKLCNSASLILPQLHLPGPLPTNLPSFAALADTVALERLRHLLSSPAPLHGNPVSSFGLP